MGFKLYDLRAVVVQVGGIPIGGFAQQDAVSCSWVDDVVVGDISADSEPLYSRTNDRRVDVTFSFHVRSTSYRDLMTLFDIQHGLTTGLGPPVPPSFPFFLQDVINGDRIRSADTIFMRRPDIVKTKSIPTVTIVAQLPDARGTIWGANNLAPAIAGL